LSGAGAGRLANSPHGRGRMGHSHIQLARLPQQSPSIAAKRGPFKTALGLAVAVSRAANRLSPSSFV
jgi:hypothetical protein